MLAPHKGFDRPVRVRTIVQTGNISHEMALLQSAVSLPDSAF